MNAGRSHPARVFFSRQARGRTRHVQAEAPGARNSLRIVVPESGSGGAATAAAKLVPAVAPEAKGIDKSRGGGI